MMSSTAIVAWRHQNLGWFVTQPELADALAPMQTHILKGEIESDIAQGETIVRHH